MKLDINHLLYWQGGCLLLIAFTIIFYRSEILSFKVFGALFGLSLLVWFLVAVLTLLKLCAVFYQQLQASTQSSLVAPLLTHIVAGLLAVVFIALIANIVYKVKSVPRIHDITTDTHNIPLFKKALEQRGTESNSLEYDPDVVRQQQVAYPYIQPLNSSLSIDDAFERALSVSNAIGWKVHNSNKVEGIIEATDTSKVFGFVDDIVIRVTQQEGGSRIDLRSVSRVGRSDLGANAARIKGFLSTYQ